MLSPAQEKLLIQLAETLTPKKPKQKDLQQDFRISLVTGKSKKRK